MTEQTALAIRQPSTALTPHSWSMIQSVAHAAYMSRKFGVTEGEAAIKLLFCYENNLPLSSANTGLYIVNGRMTVMSNIVASQIRRHPDYDYRIDQLDDKGCTITILRRNPQSDAMEDYASTSFTADDAKRAGLDKKDNYRGFPRNMFFGRAISNAQKWYCPDVFNQPVYVPEELAASIDDDGNVIDGEWVSSTAEQDPLADAPSALLQALVDEFGAEIVLAAGDGTLPNTLDGVKAVALRLMQGERAASEDE